MTQLYKLLIPDSSKNLTFILKNSANNSIFDLRSSNSTLILKFSNSALTRLRLQSFDIRLDNEPRMGTPLRRYLSEYRTPKSGLFPNPTCNKNVLP